MDVKAELQKSVNRYAEKLKKKLELDIDKMSVSLSKDFDLPQPELKKLLLERFVSKFEGDIDHCDTQALLHFVIKFSEMINSLRSHKLKDYSSISVNGFIFTPNNGVPLSIDVEQVDGKVPLGKIVVQLDMITVRTKAPEVVYHIGGEFISDEIVLSVLGSFITKLHSRTSL